MLEIIFAILDAFFITDLVVFICQVFIDLILNFKPVKLRLSRFSQKIILSLFAYISVGATLGALSGLVYEQSISAPSIVMLLNLIFAPVLFGLTMMFLGKIHLKRRDFRINSESFLFGYFFGFCFLLSRAFVLGINFSS